jgi:hypothetical protein
MNGSERIPVDEWFDELYQRDEEAARERILQSAAEGAATMPPARSLRKPSTESSSEQVRNKAFEDLNEPTWQKTINAVTHTLVGLDLEGVKKEIMKPGGLTEPIGVAKRTLKMADPFSSVAEAVAREQARRDGLPEADIERIGTTVGTLAGILVPTPAVTKMVRSKMFNQVLMNSMFSNPVSHAANITSSELISIWAIPERFLSATASALEYGVTLGKHQREVFFGEAGAMLFGKIHSFTDAIRESLHAFKTGKSTIGPSIVEDLGIFPSGMIGQGMKFWSRLWRSPTLGLGAEDAFYKYTSYAEEAYALAYREMARAGGLSVGNIRSILRNLPQDLDVRAREFATAHTLQRNIDELGPWIGGVGKVGQSIADLPMGRLVVPIVRTQTNMLHFATERTPILGQLSKTWRNDFMAGGAQRATALGKLGGGATLFMALTQFAASDIITGAGPTDPTLQRQKRELTGWQPWSFHIGDKYYGFERLAPLGSMFGAIASYSEIAGQLPEYKANELAQAITLAITHSLPNRAFLEDLSDFFEAAAGDEPALKRFLTNVARLALVPGALRGAKRIHDPTVRETDPGDVEEGEWGEVRRLINEVAANIPGASTWLEPYRNLWGYPVEVPKGWGPDWLSPVAMSTDKNDPAGDEIVRLGRLGLPIPGRHPRIILGADPDTHPIDQPASPLDLGIRLTDKEYGDFQKLAGHEGKVDGMGLHERINYLKTKDKEYRAASDPMKANIIMRFVTGHRRLAVAELLLKHQGLMEIYNERIRTKERALTGESMTSIKPLGGR